MPAEDPEAIILYMTMNYNERYLGLTVGIELPKDIFEVQEIVIFVRDFHGNFLLHKKTPFVFAEASPKFTFSRKNDSELLFLTYNEVFAFNYM